MTWAGSPSPSGASGAPPGAPDGSLRTPKKGDTNLDSLIHVFLLMLCLKFFFHMFLLIYFCLLFTCSWCFFREASLRLHHSKKLANRIQQSKRINVESWQFPAILSFFPFFFPGVDTFNTPGLLIQCSGGLVCFHDRFRPLESLWALDIIGTFREWCSKHVQIINCKAYLNSKALF